MAAAPTRLTADERAAHVAALLASSRPWTIGDGHGRDVLRKEFVFASHAEAIAFLVRLAMEADVRNHHPEYEGCYNRLTVTWTTHACGGISMLDVDMANFSDKVGPPM